LLSVFTGQFRTVPDFVQNHVSRLG
jgi:hypothetical protein